MRKPLIEEMNNDLKLVVPEKQQHKTVMCDFSQWLLEVEVKCYGDANDCTEAIRERFLGRADVAQELRQMIDKYIKEELR